jgi:hypothetical protein
VFSSFNRQYLDSYAIIQYNPWKHTYHFSSPESARSSSSGRALRTLNKVSPLNMPKKEDTLNSKISQDEKSDNITELHRNLTLDKTFGTQTPAEVHEVFLIWRLLILGPPHYRHPSQSNDKSDRKAQRIQSQISS